MIERFHISPDPRKRFKLVKNLFPVCQVKISQPWLSHQCCNFPVFFLVIFKRFPFPFPLHRLPTNCVHALHIKEVLFSLMLLLFLVSQVIKIITRTFSSRSDKVIDLSNQVHHHHHLPALSILSFSILVCCLSLK